MDDSPEATVTKLAADRPLAHQALFRHRHPDATPPFHNELINVFHDPRVKRAQFICFREAGKSTIAEEAIALLAALGLFRNGLIVGVDESLAADRLHAIKHELANNELLGQLFGDLVGETWGYARIILRNGVCIQALGRGQEVRGIKYLDKRPDFLLVDDVEGKEHVRDPAARHATVQWLHAELIPALDKNARIRLLATPLDRESLPMTLAKTGSWKTVMVPIKHRAPDGQWRASWPSRYPMAWVDAKETEMQKLGLHDDFMREYMCEADDPARKVFTADMIKVVPRVHTWQPTFAFFDPARTTNDRSASTGWAVWSWIGNKLVVWDGGGDLWKPDQIISKVFEVHNAYHPVDIGVEKSGLDEFLLQPLRTECLRRGVVVPVTAHAAPFGKRSFIEGLQPFFLAGDIEFAKLLPELAAQFLGYPSGRIDGPNALAYAPRMRPGQVIYDDFSSQHVVERCLIWEEAPVWLALNAAHNMTVGVLLQLCDGSLHILADWVKDGDAGANVKVIYDAAMLEIGKEPRCVAGVAHFNNFDTVGLRGAVAAIPATLHRGGALEAGRAALRDLLTRQRKGIPTVQIAHAAHWTLNGFAVGYARKIGKDGRMAQEASPGVYRLLLEAVEGFTALLGTSMLESDSADNWAYKDGRRYKTILPGQGGSPDAKAEWLRGGAADRINDLPQFLRRR